MKTWTVMLVVVLMFWLAAGVALAANMKLHGTLVEPPLCTVSGGKDIDVDFGSAVGVDKVDGAHYLQTISYQVTCQPGAGSWGLGLTVTGTVSGFDTAALQTDVTDLGIRLLQGSKAWPINQRLTGVDINKLPILQAVPVKKPGVKLKEGAFNATATLLADYQ
ncbi:fimbrial protein [Serratia proteamaculans]|uniref:fimbrial protein n=1 Tax=Serratia proteamaculans TaxID=28151 RepID=UPI003CFD455C